MHFKTMDPEVVLQMIAPYTNELREESERLEALYKSAMCPRCSGKDLEKFMDPKHLFEKAEGGGPPSTFMPRKLLKCKSCGTQFDVHSRLILAIPSVPGSVSRG